MNRVNDNEQMAMAEGRKRMTWGGVAWLTLLAFPPGIILAGLVTMFLWQGLKGGVTPKWHKPPPRTPQLSVATNPPPASPSRNP